MSRSSENYHDIYDVVPEDEHDIVSSSSKNDESRDDNDEDYPIENHHDNMRLTKLAEYAVYTPLEHSNTVISADREQYLSWGAFLILFAIWVPQHYSTMCWPLVEIVKYSEGFNDDPY